MCIIYTGPIIVPPFKASSLNLTCPSFQYNCETSGRVGSGGEYDVQLGFGWTNGVCLMLLDKYADSMKLNLRVEVAK